MPAIGEDAADPRNPAITIVGAGFSGLCMAITLKMAGFHDFVILEKSHRIGGTWRDNTYPGCACDVPSPLYSYSFRLKPDWSRVFAPQSEIWSYLNECAIEYGLERHIRFSTEVVGIEYQDATQTWRIGVSSGDTHISHAVISGIGALHIPKFPELPGRESFAGRSFHSAAWDHSYDFTGKRVAVVGTGASAVQFIPQIAERAGHLSVFQRTPPWIHPKPDFALPEGLKSVFRRFPGAARGARHWVYWLLESRALGFVHDPRFLRGQHRAARRHLRKQVPDPVLRAKVTPDYTIGCKRVLLSNDYYPALARDNVELVTEDIAEIRPHAIVGRSGREHPVDAIVYGTGFKVVDAIDEQHIVGRDGLRIQDAWKNGPHAHLGVLTAGFPNLFFLLGPNTGLGHTSIIFMIEAQTHYILECLRLLARTRSRAIEVKPEAEREYNRRIQRRLADKVWNTGGCRSWYLDKNEVNRSIWPGFTAEYWARTRRVNPRDFVLHR
ncbi:flavin-containing monooxygenase [Rhizohabitans arisaemae]|uniref:flavin-containing monooxygenase n=1 Tax=Rhizohabitans arisaemae TaxID=2720610 RepID=UPI0024B1BBFD|nr:NAD(P)/FAD-dependent oxidoreductase [Rhizohabitans arisaemae]